MSEPKYKVGEFIILWPVSAPEMQGIEAAITHYFFAKTKNIRTGAVSEGWRYITTVNCPVGDCWNESALRKKHDPYGPFTQMMDELKRPVGKPVEEKQ